MLLSNLKLHGTLAVENIFIEEKWLPWLTFNPGLALAGFSFFFKVAPYSFTITRAEDESSSNLCALKGKRQCFSIFYHLDMSKKMNFLAFPSVKFHETWCTGS